MYQDFWWPGDTGGKAGVIILSLYLAITVLWALSILVAIYHSIKLRWPQIESKRRYKFLTILALVLLGLLSPVLYVIFLLLWIGVFIGMGCIFLAMSCSLLTNALCGWKLPCHPESNSFRGLSSGLRRYCDPVVRLQNAVLRPQRLVPDAAIAPDLENGPPIAAISQQGNVSGVIPASEPLPPYNPGIQGQDGSVAHPDSTAKTGS